MICRTLPYRRLWQLRRYFFFIPGIPGERIYEQPSLTANMAMTCFLAVMDGFNKSGGWERCRPPHPLANNIPYYKHGDGILLLQTWMVSTKRGVGEAQNPPPFANKTMCTSIPDCKHGHGMVLVFFLKTWTATTKPGHWGDAAPAIANKMICTTIRTTNMANKCALSRKHKCL